MIDGDKDIVEMWCYESEGTLRAIARYTPSDLDITFKIYETENKRSSLVCDEAGNLYLSFFNGTSNDIYSLTYDAEKNIYQSELLTCMGRWLAPPPCIGLRPAQPAAMATPSRPRARVQSL